MKKTTKMSRAIGQIEKMYATINEELFQGKLETPIITCQTSKGSYGHCTQAKIWKNKNKETETYELNISSELLNMPIEELIDTIIHEAIHLYCRMNNIKECSRNGIYHNKKFRQEAEKRMLVCYKTEKNGWNTKGEGNDKLIEYALKHEWTEIEINREAIPTIPLDWLTQGLNVNTQVNNQNQTRTNSHSIKYKCPCCGNSVRATKKVNIECGDCKIKMVEC